MDSPVLAVTDEQARRFAGAYGLPPAILARCSTLFCVELMLSNLVHGVNPRNITDESLALEGADRRPRGTKLPEQFQREPLRGLWKKHFFSAQILPQNLLTDFKDSLLNWMIRYVSDDPNGPEGETHFEQA